jgi:hypothetical protein
MGRDNRGLTLSIDGAYHEHKVHDIDLESFSSLDMVRIHRIQKERFRDWYSRGYIKASKEAEKQGKKALFSRLDVYAVGLFKEFIETFRFSREEASKLTDLWRLKAAECKYRTTGGYFQTICFIRRDGQIFLKPATVGPEREVRFEKLADWDSILCLNIGKLIAKIDNIISD